MIEFVSITWLAWMWATVSIYWLVSRAARLYVLAALSLAFLLSIAPLSAGILTGFFVLCHAVGNREQVSVAGLCVAIGVMVGTLVWFKLGIAIDPDNIASTLIIPLGISYYTFRCIHFLMERFSGQQSPCKANELIAYLFFLPTFVIGPIHRIDDFLRDLKRQRFDAALMSDGAERILYGYVKITVLGNFLTERYFGDWIANLPDQDGALVVYLTIVKNGLNIYFQFSGHSDVAIGFARLLGYRVIENFNWPYLQPNISAFWRCWHISLSRWCRDYIYGSVVSFTRLPALGALATMVVIGLWHEISMRYLVWGMYHAAGIVIWQNWQLWKSHLPVLVPPRYGWLGHGFSVVLTVHFVWFSFVILNVEHPLDALGVYHLLLLGWF